MNANDRFKIAMRVLGWGDHETARLWFVGLEERSRHTEEDFTKPQTCPIEVRGPCRCDTVIYPVMSKIILALKGEDLAGWSLYRDEHLLQKRSEAVHTNLYPLGRRNHEDWPKEYRELFNLTRDEYEACMRESDNERFALFRDCRAKCGTPVTICFGKAGWDEFATCFQLEGCRGVEMDGGCRVYKRERIVLTPFFCPRGTSGFSDNNIRRLVRGMNRHELNPFFENNRMDRD